MPTSFHLKPPTNNPPARLALNYKGLDYETVWVEFPDIAPLMKSYGLEPNPEGVARSPYTIPAVKFPDDVYMMDSRTIATELEHRYPSPSLHLDSPILGEVEKLIPKLFWPMAGIHLPKIPKNILNPPSAEYVERTRADNSKEARSELESDPGGEKTWAQVQQTLKELGDILKANGGPFALGKTVSYADLVVVSFLHFARRVDESLYERAVAMEPSLGTLCDASKSWLERDDH